MSRRRPIFAGSKLRQLRKNGALNQAEFAARLRISTSYLSQLEHDHRPLTPRLAERVAQLFPLDWQDVEIDDAHQLAVALREALTDPIFDEAPPSDQLTKLAFQHPAIAERFVALHRSFRRTSQRLEMIDEAIAADNPGGPRLPWEEVRDWFHLSNNYVDEIDRAAEELAKALRGAAISPTIEALKQHLTTRHRVRVSTESGALLRDYDAESRMLRLDPAQPPAGMRFQIAYQLAMLSFQDTIARIADQADVRSAAAKKLLRVGLANYAAGALLMPYESFRYAARNFRHDIDRLSQTFGTSFEQTCHRLSTLQRDNARGLPFFFCRVDMAGNITKRHSATRLQFARFGGACPLWIVHEAVAIPDRILVQLAETPDGVRYVSMAKGLVKPSGSFERASRRYAVALGCEAGHAGNFIYADGLDITTEKTVTKIGISCRICPRNDCDQRAYPPSDQKIVVDLSRRGMVPYELL